MDANVYFDAYAMGRSKSNSYRQLAGDYEPFGIIFGCFLGHSIATGTACVGGKYIANKVSEKKMTILSGSVFLVFAALTLLQDPNAKVEKVDWRPSWMVAETENAM